MAISLGLDIGSISINTVLVGQDGVILEERYAWCHGRPFHVLSAEIAAILERCPASSIDLVAVTGTGGTLAAEVLGGVFVNEIVAQSAAVARLVPTARSVIEIGGEDAKLIRMVGAPGGPAGAAARLADFTMNTICAAGTGSFLDQQAKRLGLAIEGEFGELALKSEHPPRIAGRCSVFAKSDMIHLQQIATPVHDIVAGLCFAVARSIRSNLARGRPLEAPVVFQGGVAANAGVVRALREVFELVDGGLVVPQHHAAMGAIGAVYHARSTADASAKRRDGFAGLGRLADYLAKGGATDGHLEPLQAPACELRLGADPLPEGGPPIEVSLGVDVGSLSTNVVLVDRENRVVARRYLPTAGRPLEAIQRGLSQILEEVGDRVVVTSAGSTGSGRYLTGDFIGADAIRNEITAQATAAAFFEPDVDTIFEIGGQDSKFISLENGVVVDFEMNKVCAAGTGSFLEEQAEKLGISIVGEFGDLALSSMAPAKFGDRCTVFMESDLNAHQQRGTATGDLVGGLAYSIVQNYLQKVVGTKRVGRKILFQGGVANNRAVTSAFERVTGKPITVPPHFDVTGAIGCAMLAREACPDGRTRFKGWDVSRVPYALDRFTCGGCANQCEIHAVKVEGTTRPLCYGGRCEKYEVEERRHRGRGIPDLFARRQELLLDGWTEEPADGRPSVGLARGLMMFWDQFPWWRTLFRELGARIVLSRPTDRSLVTRSLESLVAETCFPVEVMHGHVRDLFERNPDFVFLPFIVDAAGEKGNPTCNYNCPWIEAYPFMVRAALEDERERAKLLVPTMHFRYGNGLVERQLADALAGPLGVDRRRVHRAVAAAEEAQRAFRQAVRREGDAVLASLPEGGRAMAIIGRPYNTGDHHLNLDLPGKLRELDVLPVPMDFLRLDTAGVLADYDMMCWPNGQRILAALRAVAADDRLSAVYLSNFRCGPDSFLLHYAREEMRGRPWLHLEVDEHSAGAGLITRLEAFLDSLRAARRTSRAAADDAPSRATPSVAPSGPPHIREVRSRPSPGRSLYFPFMSDAAEVLAATARACGIDAAVLPMQDARDLELGRRHTSSRECFPMICTTGSFLKKLEEPGVDPGRVSFFMPRHTGPCRFGQYHKMQRIILERIGCGDAEIVSPSNKTSYADFSRGPKFRLLVYKSLVAVDLLGRMRQEHRQIELTDGAAETAYRRALAALVAAIARGGREVVDVVAGAVDAFAAMSVDPSRRRPVVAVVGEIFMRANPFCSGYLVHRLEALGLETIMAPVHEWIQASSIRWGRESAWRGEPLGIVKATVQGLVQNFIAARVERRFHAAVNPRYIVPVERILDEASPYIHRDYGGDPPLAFGAAAALAKVGISGVANILPFTCLPGTIVTSIAAAFRRDHGDIPWVDVAWDGQEDVGLRTRLEAFAHQTREFAARRTTSAGL